MMTPQQKAQFYNSSLALELFLAQGGTLADWYACAASPPIETDEMVINRIRERIIAACPTVLTPCQARKWLVNAFRSAGL